MKTLNLFGKSVVSIAVIAACFGANAAQNGRVGMMAATPSSRMPTMPVVGLTTIGNTGVTTINTPVEADIVPVVNPHSHPDPHPDPEPYGCADGGVKDSDYTVEMCMNDILQCVNTGALQGGLNDLFNEDVRNSIMNGMKLCQVQVDKCISSVRVNCHNVYSQTTDVWLDFNSRIVQPEYYNFVLRKTGLTPNQAENTCLLLDRNTYGSSFSAVSDTNAVNAEYNNKVGAYNKAINGTLSKDNPQGVAVNTVGYDGNRGHYARWDASKAECLIRVAAYNKDKLITNSWLFGTVGNDTPAEVWEKAGSTFICSKDLFDFDSLLNDTRTAAVIAVPGGAVLGTAIGAGAGAAVADKKQDEYDKAVKLYNNPCTDEKYRAELGAELYKNASVAGVLKTYAYKDIKYTKPTTDEKGNAVPGKFTGEPIFDMSYNFNDLATDSDGEEKCLNLFLLREKIGRYKSVVKECSDNQKNKTILAATASLGQKTSDTIVGDLEIKDEGGTHKICYKATNTCAPISEEITDNDINVYNAKCLFVPLRIDDETGAGISGVLCNHANQCLDMDQINYQISELDKLLGRLGKVMGEEPEAVNRGKEIGKGAGIGLATGAAAGGLATAITAFVEKSNITCKVGDGLNTVSLGKSHTIDSLKDFYVKWNLNLPDTVSPTSAVVDKESWEQACSQFNNKMADCPKVQINLKDTKTGKYTLVPSACKVSGSICIINDSVATSYGIK